LSAGLYCRLKLFSTDVSEVRASSIIRAYPVCLYIGGHLTQYNTAYVLLLIMVCSNSVN
jgi:hypothetical protein